MSRAEDTRQAVLAQALELSTEVGLEGLPFGVWAKRMGMSKSGRYAHFETKEGLQCQVLDAAAERFVDSVMAPALEAPRGLPRLERLFELWLEWGSKRFRSGCLFVSAAAEFDDREGPVRDRVAHHLAFLAPSRLALDPRPEMAGSNVVISSAGSWSPRASYSSDPSSSRSRTET